MVGLEFVHSSVVEFWAINLRTNNLCRESTLDQRNEEEEQENVVVVGYIIHNIAAYIVF